VMGSKDHSNGGDLCHCSLAMCHAQGFAFHCEMGIYWLPYQVVQVVHIFDVSSDWHTFWAES
jgi:hypothetical protein